MLLHIHDECLGRTLFLSGGFGLLVAGDLLPLNTAVHIGIGAGSGSE